MWTICEVPVAEGTSFLPMVILIYILITVVPINVAYCSTNLYFDFQDFWFQVFDKLKLSVLRWIAIILTVILDACL